MPVRVLGSPTPPLQNAPLSASLSGFVNVVDDFEKSAADSSQTVLLAAASAFADGSLSGVLVSTTRFDPASARSTRFGVSSLVSRLYCSEVTGFLLSSRTTTVRL